MKELNELVELAKKATSGKWIADSGEGWDAIISQQDMVNGNFIVGEFIGPDSKPNKDFVLAASPENILAIAEAFRALEHRAEAAEAKLIPNGWQLVPVEATEDMIAAGDAWCDGLTYLSSAYEAMLAAAPTLSE